MVTPFLASQRRLPARHARLASGWLARPSRAGVAPAGLLAHFQSSLPCGDFLCAQASPGAHRLETGLSLTAYNTLRAWALGLEEKEFTMDFLRPDWIPALYKYLAKMRTDRHAELVKIGDVFGDPRLLSKYYVEPDLQHWNPADLDDEQVGGRTELRTAAFAAFNDFLKGDIVGKPGRNQMIIQSDAGMGKTSLLVMIRMMHLFEFWPRGFKCELLRISAEALGKIQEIDNKIDTVLLLDALDEDIGSSDNVEHRLREILVASRNFRRVIITCRTQYFPEGVPGPFREPGRIVLDGFTCPVWFLSPFDDAKLEKLVRKKFPTAWLPSFTRRSRKISDALTMLRRMNSLRFRPLLASHIDDLVSASTRRFRTEADVYDALIEVWLNREATKLAQKNTKTVPNTSDLRRACRLLAVRMFLIDRQTLDRQEVQELATLDADLSHLSCFDFGGRSLLNRDSDFRYRFSHRSIQEFLLAESMWLGIEFDEISSRANLTNVAKRFYLQLCIRETPSTPQEAGNAHRLHIVKIKSNSDAVGICAEELSEMVHSELGVRWIIWRVTSGFEWREPSRNSLLWIESLIAVTSAGADLERICNNPRIGIEIVRNYRLPSDYQEWVRDLQQINFGQ